MAPALKNSKCSNTSRNRPTRVASKVYLVPMGEGRDDYQIGPNIVRHPKRRKRTQKKTLSNNFSTTPLISLDLGVSKPRRKFSNVMLPSVHEHDVPTVLPDYSAKYSGETDSESASTSSPPDDADISQGSTDQLVKTIHRPWCSSPPGVSNSGVTQKQYTLDVPILVETGEPTPRGLYCYSPFGFNGLPHHKFMCFYCSKLYERPGELRHHCDEHHYGENPYECPFCGARFSAMSQYVDHLNAHIRENSFPTLKCKVCHLSFSSVSEVEAHSCLLHISQPSASTFDDEDVHLQVASKI